jgi:murein DD-endopeptidase MepM/ murein hydrolase activator NlpD
MTRTAVTAATALVLAWVAVVGGGGAGAGADEQLAVRGAAAAVRQQEPPPDAGIPPERPEPPPGAGVPAPGARYAWPLLPPPAVLGPFREPAHPFAPGHRGVDLGGAAGQPVLAARGGGVVFAGPVGGRSVVSVQHDDGLRTTYEPVRPLVRAGAIVRAGDVIAVLEPGHPSCAPAVCLHWGVRRDRNVYVDPLVLLRPPRVRLLPVPDPWPAHLP